MESVHYNIRPNRLSDANQNISQSAMHDGHASGHSKTTGHCPFPTNYTF